ncbi:MAG: esterase-like activity of phytase family protein [Alteraurantiacibacter sp.]
MRHLLTVLALAVVLAPGTFVRTRVPDRYSAEVAITALPFDRREQNGLAVTGLWQLSGMGETFGGYSAMLLFGRETIRLFSDRGFLLSVPRPDLPPLPDSRFSTRQLYPAGIPLVDLLDIESVTYSPETGQYWVGYENRHTIYRYAPRGDPQAYVEPAYTTHWSDNGGIEAMVRLTDGRFVAFHEVGGDFYAYPGDPTEGAEPEHGKVAWPNDYRPTDAVQLPDGRLVVVLRRLELTHLPVFASRLVLLDPAAMTTQTPWRPQPLIQLERLVPRDNWEAVAVETDPDGTVRLWLASDDNRSVFQRSLLAHLRFTPPPRDVP